MSSVDKALQVLVLLGEGNGLRVMDVAERLGISRSSAHRLLSALLQRDFVVQDMGKVYNPGPAFARAGLGFGRIALLRVAMRPHLEALTDRAGETCHLAVLTGTSVRFIDGIESDQTLRVRSRTGLLLPAHTSAAGKILLAERSAAELHALYPFGLPGSKPGDKSDLLRRQELRKELVAAKRRGYATNIEDTERGLVAVAVALCDSRSRAHASIAFACPTARVPANRLPRLAAILLETAAKATPELDRQFNGDSREVGSISPA